MKPKLGENFTLGYERGCDWSATNETAIIREGDPRTERLNMMLMESSDPTNWKAAIKLASESDVVIAALGETQLYAERPVNVKEFVCREIRNVF